MKSDGEPEANMCGCVECRASGLAKRYVCNEESIFLTEPNPCTGNCETIGFATQPKTQIGKLVSVL